MTSNSKLSLFLLNLEQYFQDEYLSLVKNQIFKPLIFKGTLRLPKLENFATKTEHRLLNEFRQKKPL